MSRPRVCGPDVIESKYPSVNEEPSPRAWAGHTHDSHTVRHLGAVPACVGRTRTLPIAVKTYLSRPRVRGPDMSREPAIWTQSAKQAEQAIAYGAVPACVGRTW